MEMYSLLKLAPPYASFVVVVCNTALHMHVFVVVVFVPHVFTSELRLRC